MAGKQLSRRPENDLQKASGNLR